MRQYKMSKAAAAAGFVGGVLTLGCASTKLAMEASEHEDWAPLIETVYFSYEQFACVTNGYRWAPWLCTAQPQRPQEQIAQSRAPEFSPHGRKLYQLYTNDYEMYIAASRGESDGIGLTVVKEAHESVMVSVDEPFDPLNGTIFGRLERPATIEATEGGGRYVAGMVSSIFVMTKVGPTNTPGTDEGWVYGTAIPPNGAVLQSGPIASCIGCHSKTPHNRLFGID